MHGIALGISCVVFLAGIIFLAMKLKRLEVELHDEPTVAVKRADKALLKEIEVGFENREFKLYLQFSVDNKTKKPVSAEALSRWEKENGDIVMPDAYIGTMERTGFISKLDYYMFEKACEKLSQWKGTDFEDLSLSCNFTRITISQADFASQIEEIAERYDFNRSKLFLEITEDSMENNTIVAMRNIIQVKRLGFGISLDDLGSGYTSLMSLCEYPINVVKIDRDILLKTKDENGRKLLKGIISLAHDLNLQVVCEGVETEEQNRFVTATRCDIVQGWYYFKAQPESKAEAAVRAYMEQFR